MTAIPPNPAVPYPAPTGGRLSKSALSSLILGILGCIPFVTGALALLTGIIGFVKTGKPGVKGRWMAVLGSILGVLSLIGWTLGFTVFGAAIFAVVGLTQAPANTTHDFIREISAGNIAAAKTMAPDVPQEGLEKMHDDLSPLGTFIDTTLPTRQINNSSAHIEGTATFEKGKASVTADLELEEGGWHIQGIKVKQE